MVGYGAKRNKSRLSRRIYRAINCKIVLRCSQLASVNIQAATCTQIHIRADPSSPKAITHLGSHTLRTIPSSLSSHSPLTAHRPPPTENWYRREEATAATWPGLGRHDPSLIDRSSTTSIGGFILDWTAVVTAAPSPDRIPPLLIAHPVWSERTSGSSFADDKREWES